MSEKDKFKELLEGRKYSKGTIQAYVRWLEQLRNYYSRQDVDDLIDSEIVEFIRFLSKNRNLSASSSKQARCALELYFKDIAKRDIDLSKLKQRWIYRATPEVPTQREVRVILEKVTSPLCRTALAFIYSTGIQLSDAIHILVRDVDLAKGTTSIRLKRGHVRRVIIAHRLISDIKELIKDKKQDEYLFSIAGKQRNFASTLQKSFTKAKKRTGINKPYSIRSLRYAYIKHLEFFGVPLINIIEEIGLSKKTSLNFYSSIQHSDETVTFSPFDRSMPSEEINSEITPGSYVSEQRISELSAIRSTRFDLVKLLELLRELNAAHRCGSHMSVAMVVRSIIDHVPPIFGFNMFKELTNNYHGSRSFKKSMIHLNNSLRNVADSFLHVRIRQKESIPTFNQVDFRADIDVLLGEIVRIL